MFQAALTVPDIDDADSAIGTCTSIITGDRSSCRFSDDEEVSESVCVCVCVVCVVCCVCCVLCVCMCVHVCGGVGVYVCVGVLCWNGGK